jgi:cyanophycin synthetase
MQRLLADPAVDIGIAELARGGILKRGMVLDWIDVAAVLNVGHNHVGLDGIASREELARVKSTIVRRARQWAFLLADDPLVLAMREVMQPGAQLGLVSRDSTNPALARHRKAGGCTVTLEGTGKAAKIVVRQGDAAEFELKLAAIPASQGGASMAIAENAMFASVMALKLGLSGKDIAATLRGFVSDTAQNPGRHNHIEGLPFELMLTWADGFPALDELLERLDSEPPAARRHLYLAVPGTRSDDWHREMGRRAAGHFDHYWCVDMDDLRGRRPLESAQLVAEGLREKGVAEAAITCLAGDARKATEVLTHVAPGERMTMMVYDTAAALRDVETFRRGLENG